MSVLETAPAPRNARAIVATVWALSFAISLVVPFVLLATRAIESDGLQPSLTNLSGVYAPNVGAILAYYFGTRKRPPARGLGRGQFVTALAVSVIWNLAVLTLLLPTLWGGAGLVDATRTAGQVAPQLAWIVAPVMGFFFAKAAD